jgi:copper chaperone NosL
MRRPEGSLLLALTLAVATGCAARTPRAIAWGREACAHCHMTLADHRFAAELLTRAGRAVVFDDIGCLAAWMRDNPAPGASAWVANFTSPDAWLRADSAMYLRTESLGTPMGSGLAALRPSEADSVRQAMGGTLHSWPEVLASPPDHALPGAR